VTPRRDKRESKRRWELTAADRERLSEPTVPIGVRGVARALLSKPALISGTVRNAVRGATQGLRDDPELGWYLASRRLQQRVPDAATGVQWHGAENFVEVLDPYLGSSTRALEVGCGAGRVSRLVAPRVRELVCSDVSKPMLEEAAENLAGFDNVRLVLANGRDLEAIDQAPFDVILAHNVLVTFDPDPAVSMLDSMRRVLRPGGVCVVSFLTIDDEEWARWQIEQIRSAGPSGHFGAAHPRAYASCQVDAMVKLAGFDLVEGRHGDPATDTGRPHYHAVGKVPDGPAGHS
jgi:SAM-dependent methyltransferase